MSESEGSIASCYELVSELKLWEDSGDCCLFRLNIDSELFFFLMNNLEEAKQIKNEKRNERSLYHVIRDISLRGVILIGQIIEIDKKDLVGLTGEILTEFFIHNQDLELIYSKWRFSGSSKSRGIDLIAREKESGEWFVVLFESKHIHDEVKGIKIERIPSIIRNKYRLGIDEFEVEKTMLSIARLTMQIGEDIRRGESMGGNVTLFKRNKDLLSKCLDYDDFQVRVIVFIDKKYFMRDTFYNSIDLIQKPIHLGERRRVMLMLVESKSLEEITDKVCDKFVG